MRSIGYLDPRFLRVCAALAVVCALFVLTSGSSAYAAGSGLAYDELTKIVMSTDQNSGPPEAGSYANGSFAGDFQAAVNAAQPPKKHNGMFSAITNAMEEGQRAMNMMKVGMPSTHYYLNGWERTDDPGTQTATIYRGDQGQRIHLDLEKKTYWVETANEKMAEGGPPPMPSGHPGPQASPQPGTAKMTITATSAALGPKTLDGQPTSGYKMAFKLAVTNATGSCSNGSFGTSMTEYLSHFQEPTISTPGGKAVTHKSMPDPQMMAVKPGCKPTITANTKMGATPPSGRLSLWTYMAMNASMNAPQPQASSAPSGNFGFLTERGNVRALGPTDAGLFQAPAGFTQVSPPNSTESSPNP